jgi:hypothetical protein
VLDFVMQIAENLNGQNGAVVAADPFPPEPWRVPMLPASQSNKVSTRTRFEVFKRDDFTCQYCGRKSPEVILEVDHIVPRCDGGSDDQINLTTSCWDCNRGKAGVPLDQFLTGEDPHDRAIELLEKHRQLNEYNHVLAGIMRDREVEAQALFEFWCDESGRKDMPRRHFSWIVNRLAEMPASQIREAMWAAIAAGATKDLRYVMAVVRNWKEAAQDRP